MSESSVSFPSPCFTNREIKQSLSFREAITRKELLHLRHYEIVFLVHPDQSEQVNAMIERYRSIIESANGGNPPLRRLGPTPACLSDQQNPQSALCVDEHRVRRRNLGRIGKRVSIQRCCHSKPSHETQFKRTPKRRRWQRRKKKRMLVKRK